MERGFQAGKMLRLLNDNDWGSHQARMDRLGAWPGYGIFLNALTGLKRGELYQSPIHGEDHIERTLLHGIIGAMEEGLGEADIRLLMEACSYHDVGRINDGLDDEHGLRSAEQMGRLTGRTGDELAMLMAMAEAHSRSDLVMDQVIEKYRPRDKERCRMLAELLKDADGLDRVRIRMLDPSYLRRRGARDRVAFAQYLFERYTPGEI